MAMALPNARLLNLAGFLACAGMMGFALYAEHVLLLEPCPLCVFQRVAVISLGLVFLAAAIVGPSAWGRYVVAVLILAAAGGGAGVAAWHHRLQNLPPDEIPGCGPGLDYILDAFPLTEALRMVFSGSGECAEVVWSFLGLSMPGWVFVCLVLMGAGGIVANLKAPTTA